MNNNFDRSKHVFVSTAFEEIIKDTIRFFNGTPVLRLPPPESFAGTGVYALYYTGSCQYYFEPYRFQIADICRERVMIVGIRNDLGPSWSFPEGTHSEDALLWDKYVTGDYWKRHNIAPSLSEVSRSQLEKDRLYDGKYGIFPPSKTPWLTVRDALYGLSEPMMSGSPSEHCLRNGAKEYVGHSGSDLDMPAKTLKAGDHGVPGGENMLKYPDGRVRYFTVLEAKRIQTFPDDYSIVGSWSEAMRQLGNAVPVKLAHIISESLFSKVFTN